MGGPWRGWSSGLAVPLLPAPWPFIFGCMPAPWPLATGFSVFVPRCVAAPAMRAAELPGAGFAQSCSTAAKPFGLNVELRTFLVDEILRGGKKALAVSSASETKSDPKRVRARFFSRRRNKTAEHR